MSAIAPHRRPGVALCPRLFSAGVMGDRLDRRNGGDLEPVATVKPNLGTARSMSILWAPRPRAQRIGIVRTVWCPTSESERPSTPLRCLFSHRILCSVRASGVAASRARVDLPRRSPSNWHCAKSRSQPVWSAVTWPRLGQRGSAYDHCKVRHPFFGSC